MTTMTKVCLFLWDVVHPHDILIDEDQSHSVLQAHLQKNGTIQPPDPDSLADHQLANREHQPSQRASATPNNAPNDTPTHDGHDDLDDNGVPLPPRTRATRNMKKPEDAKPNQINFYAGPWVEALLLARNYHRLYIHCDTENPFPERNAHTLQLTHSFLLEAIEYLSEDDREALDHGAP